MLSVEEINKILTNVVEFDDYEIGEDKRIKKGKVYGIDVEVVYTKTIDGFDVISINQTTDNDAIYSEIVHIIPCDDRYVIIDNLIYDETQMSVFVYKPETGTVKHIATLFSTLF